VDAAVVTGVFTLLGAAGGAITSTWHRRHEARDRADAELRSTVVEYVTAVDEVVLARDVLGLRDALGERWVTRLIDTSAGRLVTAPFRLAVLLALPVLHPARHGNELRRAARRLALIGDPAVLEAAGAIESLLRREQVDEHWLEEIDAARNDLLITARRALAPRRGWFSRKKHEDPGLVRLLDLPPRSSASLYERSAALPGTTTKSRAAARLPPR
jgi:hypothetical protein